MKLPSELIFYFCLIFRILFYSFFLILIFSKHAKKFSCKNCKTLNIIISIFGLCYIGYIIPLLFDGKDYGGSIKLFLFIWTLFFSYLLLFINKFQNKPNPIKNPLLRSRFAIIIFIVISFLNSSFNYHSYHGTWYGDYITETYHGVLSFLLPLFVLLTKNIIFSRRMGSIVLILALSQFIFGISLSYGVDGYLTDEREFLPIFLGNSLILLSAGLYYTFPKLQFKQ